MPNSFQRCAGLCCAILLTASGAWAQSAAPVPETPPVAPAPEMPAPLKPAPVDLSLLQRALLPLVKSKAVDSESEMQIFASRAGASFTLREHLKVTASRPGHFTSLVTLLPEPGAKATRYRVASDGRKVTTYAPNVKKYAVSTLAQFEAGDDDFPSLGLVVGLLYLGDTSFIKGLSSITKDGTGMDMAMLRKMGMALTTKTLNVDGITYATFALQIGKVGQYRFYIDPTTSQLAQVEMKTVQDGVTIRMVEKVLAFTPVPSVPPTTFHAVIPASARKVPKLTINFF